MSDMDLLEMACDCNARSMEFGTDLLEFIDIRQKERFRFPEEIYQIYYNYCKILVDSEEYDKDEPGKVFIKQEGES
jgi:hypothetical protein